MQELRFELSKIYSGKPHQTKYRKAFRSPKTLRPQAVSQYSPITNFKKASKPLPTTRQAITESSTLYSTFKINARHVKWFSSPKTSTCVYVQKALAYASLKIIKPTNSSMISNTSPKASNSSRGHFGMVSTMWKVKP